ncbi:MAG TPA: histidine phosphatase family protein [Candidatus Saccharimonadales bacterium]|nr:histidine phosphatase family protein [Candidatus Saccharimonadales bacterium]
MVGALTHGQLPETLIIFRHGKFEGNEHTDLTNQIMAGGFRLRDFDDKELLPEGEDQANRLGLALHIAGFTVRACMRSPTRRTECTAKIVLAHLAFDGKVEVRDNLMERNRGRFTYAPAEQSELDPEYYIGKESTLRWLPASGQRPGTEGETIQAVIDKRLRPEVYRAGMLVPSGIVAFATHHDVVVAGRGMDELGSMDDNRLKEPLIPQPPANIPILRMAKLAGNGQADIYTRRHPDTSSISDRMTHFRSIIVDPLPFDTGWLEIVR